MEQPTLGLAIIQLCGYWKEHGANHFGFFDRATIYLCGYLRR